MTIAEALRHGEEQLQTHTIPADDALPLLAHSLGMDTTSILTHVNDDVDEDAYAHYVSLLARRAAGFSVAVLKGFKEFYGLDFKVTAETLVPRPETELLVDRGLHYLKQHDHIQVLDVGTGSGCIIIALALHDRSDRHAHFFACDVSDAALSVARENAKRHHVSVHFFTSNLFQHATPGAYGLLLANLPYLSTQQLKEPSIKREPIGALWGGSDGLDLYRAFFDQAPRYTADHFCILVEFDPAQTQTMLELGSRAFPDATLDVLRDLAGRDRILVITH